MPMVLASSGLNSMFASPNTLLFCFQRTSASFPLDSVTLKLEPSSSLLTTFCFSFSFTSTHEISILALQSLVPFILLFNISNSNSLDCKISGSLFTSESSATLQINENVFAFSHQSHYCQDHLFKTLHQFHLHQLLPHLGNLFRGYFTCFFHICTLCPVFSFVTALHSYPSSIYLFLGTVSTL